jgi:hypothetical protein
VKSEKKCNCQPELSNQLMHIIVTNLLFSVPPAQCPVEYPYVYFNGSYCCSVNRETVYTPQGKLDKKIIFKLGI